MDFLLALDQKLFLWINVGWSSSWLDSPFYYLTHLGGQTAGFIFPLVVLALSRSGWSFLFSGLTYGVNAAVFKSIKYTVLRTRPLELAGAILRQSPELTGATDPSFPSGHAAISFMMAVFLSARYPRLSPLFLLLAGLICLSRIYLGLHYPSDVLVGALIGAAASGLLLYIGRKTKRLEAWFPAGPPKAAE
ncbi:MAG: phosphatase PAP2 family protein [Thermodesulfobacteriota bacterium]